MGKTLVHRTKMVQVAPQEGELGTVYAAALPRSAVVQGTFQVRDALTLPALSWLLFLGHFPCSIAS